LTADRKAK